MSAAPRDLSAAPGNVTSRSTGQEEEENGTGLVGKQRRGDLIVTWAKCPLSPPGRAAAVSHCLRWVG